MKLRLYRLLLSVLLSTSAYIAEVVSAEIVNVGVYNFPPYVFIAEQTTGLSVQMIAAMNKFQNKYEFVAVPTTARRRYIDFENKKFDMMIFESKNWGWGKYPITISQAFVTGAEVYVTQAKPGRGQNFFSDFKNKAMIGVLGYHYQFAGFNAEQDYLKKNFNLIQTNSQKQSLELIFNNRGEIAVVSKEYLNYHFTHSPEDKAKLLISDKVDQVYQHAILIRKNNNLSINYINKLLSAMKQKGTLTQLWEGYDLDEIHE